MKQDNATVRIDWKPDIDGKPGADFLVKYRIKGKDKWLVTDRVVTDDITVVQGLLSNKSYEFKVVSVDGEFMTESDPQDVITTKVGMLVPLLILLL